MSHKVITGLVVHSVEYNESDLILTVLTNEDGKLTVTARGARRSNSQHAAASQILCCSRMILSEYRERYTLKEAEIIETFSALRGDLLQMSLGCYLADLAQMLAPEGDALRLVFTALHVLAKDRRKIVKPAFEMRALCDAGFEPRLESCGHCGAVTEMMFLMPWHGTSLCSDCARAKRGETLLPMSADVRRALAHIRAASLEKVFSFTLGDVAAAQLTALCERYMLAQINHPVSSLEFYLGLL